MATRNKGAQLHAINGFWQWFAANAERLIVLHGGGHFEELGRQVADQINRIEPQLAWEIGPGKNEPYLLTISGEGNPGLRQLANLVVRQAPPLKGWEFYASRPARPASEVVRFPERGESFETALWEFVPSENVATGRLDLIIVDDSLARSDHEIALRAVSVYLDELLGEDMVEEWIGGFEVWSRIRVSGKKTYKMAELPDYLEWATNRRNEPLTKHVQ